MKLPWKEKNKSKNIHVYEEGKTFEIQGGACFRQVCEMGKIEYVLVQENEKYLILPVYIRESIIHDDGEYSSIWYPIDNSAVLELSWEGFLTQEMRCKRTSEVWFEEVHANYSRHELWLGIKLTDSNTEIVRGSWGVQSGWKEDSYDEYLESVISVECQLKDLKLIEIRDSKEFRDGLIIEEGKLRRCASYCVSNLAEDSNKDIFVIKSGAVSSVGREDIWELYLPKECKVVEEAAFVASEFETIYVPEEMQIDFHEYAFVDCTAVDVHCPKCYEEHFRRWFPNADINYETMLNEILEGEE